MTNFDLAFKIMSDYEFSNPFNVLHVNPGETGFTFWGIYEAVHPNWKGWNKVIKVFTETNGDIKKASYILYQDEELRKLVKDFYKTTYWDYLKCDNIDIMNAVELFEMSVNLGRKTAAKIFQKALNLLNNTQITIDGVVGKHTLSLYKLTDKKLLYKTLNGLQFNYYLSLVEKRPQKYKRFFKGWLRRVDF